MPRKRQTIKLVCTNSKCINKSVVYRTMDSTGDYHCKACDQHLTMYRGLRELQQNILAKKDLNS